MLVVHDAPHHVQHRLVARNAAQARGELGLVAGGPQRAHLVAGRGGRARARFADHALVASGRHLAEHAVRGGVVGAGHGGLSVRVERLVLAQRGNGQRHLHRRKRRLRPVVACGEAADRHGGAAAVAPHHVRHESVQLRLDVHGRCDMLRFTGLRGGQRQREADDVFHLRGQLVVGLHDRLAYHGNLVDRRVRRYR